MSIFSVFTRFLKVGELVHPDWNLFKSPIQYSGVKQMAEEYQKSKEQGMYYFFKIVSKNFFAKLDEFFIYFPPKF